MNAGRADAGRPDAGPLEGEPARPWSLAGGAFLGLLLGAMAGMRHDATSWTAAAVLAAAVGIVYREAPSKARRISLEVGALVLTAALQRAAIFAPDVSVTLRPAPGGSAGGSSHPAPSRRGQGGSRSASRNRPESTDTVANSERSTSWNG